MVMVAAMSPSASSSSEKKPPLSLQSASRCVHLLTTNILSHLPFSALFPGHGATIPKITSSPSPLSVVALPFLLSSSSSPASSYSFGGIQNQASPSSALSNIALSVRVDGHGSSGKSVRDGGPAFVGQVFSMQDRSGSGLMAVTTHFDIPFITKRVPKWVKDMFASVTKKGYNGPVFRFFMDLGDAVTYVKRLKVATGIVGACHLDVAYEHFKEKPHMFQFVPNKEQVKAANKLLNAIPNKGRTKRVQGVPVFTAENLNIAIATTNGIKWYTPYFFDKYLLDKILEASVDQHFQALIHSRHRQRRHDIIDDGLTTEMVENVDNIFEPVEVQDLLEEIGQPALPLSVLSKAAEIQLLDVVDKVLLGNKWLRKTTGIQPKFPYLVDSFEERTAACFRRTRASASSPAKDEIFQGNEDQLNPFASKNNSTEGAGNMIDHSIGHKEHRFPFGDWFSNPWSWLQGNQHKPKGLSNSSQVPPNPLMPKITMVGISVGDGGQVNEANLKKTMEDLSKSLEQESLPSGNRGKDKDPLFVANVGDYSSVTRTRSA